MRLNGVATLIGIVGLSVAGAVLVVLWIRLVCQLIAVVCFTCKFMQHYLDMLIMTTFHLNCRYFTGHTKNPDGNTQFVAGTTGVKQGFLGAIRILTIAVRI